jgi:hypothetical protein
MARSCFTLQVKPAARCSVQLELRLGLLLVAGSAFAAFVMLGGAFFWRIIELIVASEKSDQQQIKSLGESFEHGWFLLV